MNLFQWIVIPLFVGLAVGTLTRMSRRKMGKRAGLFWTLVWVAGAAAVAWPDSLAVLAGLLGIGRGTDLVAYLTVLALLLLARHFYSRYRHLENLVTELTRHLAIIEAHPPAPGTANEREDRQ